MRLRLFLFLGFLQPVAHAIAADEVLLRAVGFGVTGSDDAKVEVIDASNCVFRVKTEVFHLNNVQVDRLQVQSWKATNAFGERHYVTVALHGDATVYEKTDAPLLVERSSDNANMKEFERLMRKSQPDAFKPSRTVSNERTLELATSEYDRVVRAWQYIYSHGCNGSKSPF
jgi:hypothetical protein